jgi:hypothetical protein
MDCEHQHAAFRPLSTQGRRQLDAVHLGQRDVQHDDIGNEFHRQTQRGAAVARLAHDGQPSIRTDQSLQAGEHDRMIVNHQNAHRSGRHTRLASGMRT